MSNQPPSPYVAALTGHVSSFCDHKTQLARNVEDLRQRGLDAIFAAHPDLHALAFQISVNPYSEEVRSDFAGVVAGGEVLTEHPAIPAAHSLYEALELAYDALFAGDCLELREEVIAQGATWADQLEDPDGGFEQFLH